MTPEQVSQLIQSILPCDSVEVEGDGHHFYASIVSSAFEGLKLLERHRLVKEKLAHKIASNELHALSLRLTKTPAEMQQQ